MAIYKDGKMLGVVGYNQLYPDINMPPIEELVLGLPRIWAVRLISNIQNKLVGKPFYNPYYTNESISQIDVPRFFLGPDNQEFASDVINRYKRQYATQQPMGIAAFGETPLFLLKQIMAMPECHKFKDIPELEQNLFKAFLIANQITMNRELGIVPYSQNDEIELHVASLLMSRYAYDDFDQQESCINDLFRSQCCRITLFFNYICNHPLLKDIYTDFLSRYEITSWHDYIRTYLSIIGLTNQKTGIVDFRHLVDASRLLPEQIVDDESIDIHKTIPLKDNIDYVAFREKPFIKIAPHKYAVINISFVIQRMYNGVYFIFNNLWRHKHPEKPNGFNQLFTSEFSEGTILVDSLKDITRAHGWFSLSDKECRLRVPEHKLSSPPDFFIRDGENVFLFECKDVKIQKEIKSVGSIQQLLKEVDKNLVGHQDNKGKWRNKGVGQLVKNAQRIQKGLFAWDNNTKKSSRIFPVLVVADPKQVAAGWKNYLNRKMLKECSRLNVNCENINPLILTDLSTLILYKNNFKEYGFLHYFLPYYQNTTFNDREIENGDRMTAIINQTLSFSEYMSTEASFGRNELWQNLVKAINVSQ